MIVHFRSMKIIDVKKQMLSSTLTRPEQTLTTTTFDMSSVEDHVLDVKLGRLPAVLWMARAALVVTLAVSLPLFWVPLVILGGKNFLTSMLLFVLLVLVLVGLPVARRFYIKKEMESCVKEARGAQERFQVVRAQDWSRWSAKLTKPSILDGISHR